MNKRWFVSLLNVVLLSSLLMSSCDDKSDLDADEFLEEEFDPVKDNIAQDAVFHLQQDGAKWEVKSYALMLTSSSTTEEAGNIIEGASYLRLIAYNKTLEKHQPRSRLDSLVIELPVPFKTYPGAARVEIQTGNYPLLEHHDLQSFHTEFKSNGVYRPDYASGNLGSVNINSINYLFANDPTNFGLGGDFNVQLVRENQNSIKKNLQGSFKLISGVWNLP